MSRGATGDSRKLTVCWAPLARTPEALTPGTRGRHLSCEDCHRLQWTLSACRKDTSKGSPREAGTVLCPSLSRGTWPKGTSKASEGQGQPGPHSVPPRGLAGAWRPGLDTWAWPQLLMARD